MVGILAPTGTPVDRTVHISLQALEAIHLDWSAGAPMKGLAIPAEQARKFDLEPKQVTAALVGLKGRAAVFAVQRFVNEYEGEPLMAVLPGVALDELWDVVGVGETLLLALSALVALVSLAGLVATVLAGLNERRRELAVLRAVGAGPRHVLLLLAAEGLLVTLAGVALGVLASVALIALAGPWVQSHYGMALKLAAPSASQGLLLGARAGRGHAGQPGARACAPTGCRWPTACRRAAEPRTSTMKPIPRSGCSPLALALPRPPPARRTSPRPSRAPARAGFAGNHLGRTGAQGLGPAQAVQGHELRRAQRRRPARRGDAEEDARGLGQRADQQRDGRQDGPHPRLRGAARRRQGRHDRVPARALLRRLHPHAAAAVEPDHPRACRSEPAKGLRSMDTVWIDGTLKTLRSDTFMGASGYKLEAVSIEPYTEKK